MSKTTPNARPALIAFGSTVEVFGDGSARSQVVSGPALSSLSQMIDLGKAYSAGLKPAAESAGRLCSLVANLSENGGTALGPGSFRFPSALCLLLIMVLAVAYALGMAASSPGSKIIICTDGLANEGIGQIETAKSLDAQEKVKAFYSRLGQMARDNGSTFNVLSIRFVSLGLIEVSLRL